MSENAIPRESWDDFLAGLDWRQGEHVSLIGPTGAGKTTLALALLPVRNDVIVFGTKPKDRTLDKLLRAGWRRIRDVARLPENARVRTENRIVFWPKVETDQDIPNQAHEIGSCMRWAYLHHNWCLFVDELWYAERVLGLTRLIELLLSQGRSVGITMVVGTQRPAHVSLLIYDQATHVFFWRDNDERNLRRIAGMNGQEAGRIRATVSTLGRHECLYVNTRTGRMVVTKAPAK